MLRARTRTVLILLAIAFALYLVGNERVTLWDRDEPRYAQTSRQMLQSGDWVVPHFLDTVRTAKPVFIYWCQAASMAVFGDTASAARLPSAIAMTATLALLAAVIGGKRGVWTIIVLGTSIMTVWSAKSALTDAVLLLFITIAQLCIYQMWRGRFTWPTAIALGAAVGLAGLTKGPVVLGVLASTVLALASIRMAEAYLLKKRTAGQSPRLGTDSATLNDLRPSLRSARNLMGNRVAKLAVSLVIVVAIVTPWLILVEHRYPGFLKAAIGKEVIERAGSAQEGHSGPPGYYFLTIWGTFFPWSLLLPAAIVTGWTHRRIPQIRFALAAVIGPWLMLEVVKTKLPHYLLPAYPFLAYLTADMLVRAARKRIPDLVNPAFVKITLGWAVLVGLLGLIPWIAWRWYPLDRNTVLAMVVFSIVAVEWGRDVYMSFRAKKPFIAAGMMAGGMAMLVAVAFIGVLPGMEFLRVSKQAADFLITNDATGPGQVIMIDYKEPTLAFYQGGSIREEWRNDFLSITQPIQWNRWIVTTSDVWATVPEDRRERLEVVKTIEGLDYAGKGKVSVVILRRRY